MATDHNELKQEEQPSTFNPLDHLFIIERKEKTYNPETKKKEEHLKQTPYLPVQWRVVWLHETKPKRILFEILEETIDLDRLCEKIVYINNQQTIKQVPGWARVRGRLTIITADEQEIIVEATKVETAADFSDFVEKAGTGALGRCLAQAGFGTQFASLEFGEELRDRPVDAPVAISNGRRPTNEEIESLRQLARTKGKTLSQDPTTLVQLQQWRARLEKTPSPKGNPQQTEDQMTDL